MCRYTSLLLISFTLFFACKTETKKTIPENIIETKIEYKYSLGQWSFNKELFDGSMNTFDFIKVTKELGFDGVDFVNQFFIDEAKNMQFLDSIKMALDNYQLEAAMIMIDREGDLGNPVEKERIEAVENHKQWIDAAQHINCKVIRVNAFGNGSSTEVLNACHKSISTLADYAKTKNVLVLIENHGGYSSDANWLVELIKRLKGKNVALLPDFDNWCIERENGERWGAPCINEYDRYKGMEQLLPFAKSLSIKSFGFDSSGNEIKIDYHRMFEIVHNAKYKDYLGIEYEGHNMKPKEGIQKTMTLVKSIIEKKD